MYFSIFISDNHPVLVLLHLIEAIQHPCPLSLNQYSIDLILYTNSKKGLLMDTEGISLYDKLPLEMLAGFYYHINKNIENGILSNAMYHEINLIEQVEVPPAFWKKTMLSKKCNEPSIWAAH